MKIAFVTTGGTIDKVYFDARSEYAVGEPQIAEILREGNVRFEVVVEAVLAKDSLDLTDDDRRLIRDRVAALQENLVVITHGTDTMIATAKVLADIPGKTMVLTGSMQPARFRNTDATFNVGVAIGAVQSLPPGVYLSMNGRIWKPEHLRKNREEHCFEETAD